MSLKISKIYPKGDETDERITFTVTADCNLGDYILADDTFANNKPSNKLRNTFFFPSVAVKKGEWVSLRTKKGKYNVVEATTSSRGGHQFYWGLDKSVWNDSGDCAHLLLSPLAERPHKQAQ